MGEGRVETGEKRKREEVLEQRAGPGYFCYSYSILIIYATLIHISGSIRNFFMPGVKIRNVELSIWYLGS